MSGCEFADSERIYGIGASMSGYGIRQLAMSCPDIFAAIVPICGGGMYRNAERLFIAIIWFLNGCLNIKMTIHSNFKIN